MAKTVKCAFCGKEMVSGFFKGEDKLALLGGTGFSCCEDCYNHYELDNTKETKRFDIKLANYKKTNKIRRLSDSEVLELYKVYFTQMQAYRNKREKAGQLKSLGYFHGDDAGHFCVTEFALGSVISARDMAKAIDKLEAEPVCAFDGSDISRIEYRIVDKLGNDTGKAFTTAYLFEIWLNDPREMTYRPCVAYFCSTGTAFLAHNSLKEAEAGIAAALRVLKCQTGTSAQVVKVK